MLVRNSDLVGSSLIAGYCKHHIIRNKRKKLHKRNKIIIADKLGNENILLTYNYEPKTNKVVNKSYILKYHKFQG